MSIIIKQGPEDGYLWLADSSWPPTTPGGPDTSNVYMRVGCVYWPPTYYIWRVYLRFDCSQLSIWGTVLSAKLWLKTWLKRDLDKFQVQLQFYKVNGDWYPLDTGDWGCGSDLFATKNYADIPDYDNWWYVDVPATVINKGGITAFEIRGNHESGATPTNENAVEIYSGNRSGNEPYLEIEYQPPPGSGHDVPIIAGG